MARDPVRSAVDSARPAVGSPLPEPPEDDVLDRELAALPRNDLGNAGRLIARFGRDLLHVHDLGWLSWDGRRWDREGGDAAARIRAQRTAELMPREAAAMNGEGGWAKAEFAEHRKWALASGMSQRVTGMLREAEARMSVARDRLDADPGLLNVANGTIELGEREADGTVHVMLREHRRDDLLTLLAPVAYDEEALCPRWDAFLAEVQPDPEVALFLRRWAGYCLTGFTGEQCAVLFYGSGANGKSTFLNVMRGLLGDYAETLPVETLLEETFGRSGSAATPELARLPGRRAAMASEPEKKRRLSTAAIKVMTGGEPMLVRDNLRSFFQLHPVFKIFLSFNVRPIVPAEDEGMWRRIRLVPWTEMIPEARRIRNFEHVLLTEGAGILNWALDGFRQWRETGLAPPDAVKAATDDYRADSDHIGEFLEICTRRVPGLSTTAEALYRAYAGWCQANAIEPWSMRAFGKSMSERGIRRIKASRSVYQGLDLKPEWFDGKGPQ